ncbi:MAG: M20/M25/M40 family metallo-hydrolase [Bythopirellula sp.]
MVLRAPGEGGQRAPILWETHQDTVGVTGMKIDPFAATESRGRIWGRGACDVKGALAAMLAALTRIQAAGVAPPRTILLAFTINEECGFSGIKTLSRLWENQPASPAEADPATGPLSLDEIRALRPERAIVAEPTLLDVVVAHKGSLRWRCRTHGKAAHTSRPEQGINAISTMVRVVQTIEQYQSEVLQYLDPHPLCGQPTVCVSTIQGGTGVNTVPDQAVIDIDRRLTPGETPDQAYQELVDYLAQHNEDCVAAIEHQRPTNQSIGLQDDNNRGWAEQIAATASSPGATSRLIGVPYGTDAWAVSQLGIPTVVFGPGSIEQAHTDDEWIDIEQLERATEIFYRLALAG